MKLIDLCGQRFGRLLVERQDGRSDAGSIMWLCRCDCGGVKSVLGSSLRRGHTRSCGCLIGDFNVETKTIHGHAKKGHMSPEFRAWEHLKERCYYPKFIHFHLYGGRGIRVCDRWLHGEDGKTGFECFLEDMGPRPSPKHSVDRFPDQNGNYEPSNCRWATDEQQHRNKRNNRYVTVGGHTATIAEQCERYGISDAAVRSRLSLGWDLEAAYTTPTRGWVQRNKRKNAKKERAI